MRIFLMLWFLICHENKYILFVLVYNLHFAILARCIFRLQYQDATENVGSQQASQWEATHWHLGVCLSSTSTPVWSGSSALEHKTNIQRQVRELLDSFGHTLVYTHGKLYDNGTVLCHRVCFGFFKSVGLYESPWPTRHSRATTLVCRDIC